MTTQGYAPSKAYGHYILPAGAFYIIAWRHDRWCAARGGPAPFTQKRVATRQGAEEFAERWGIEVPDAR